MNQLTAISREQLIAAERFVVDRALGCRTRIRQLEREIELERHRLDRAKQLARELQPLIPPYRPDRDSGESVVLVDHGERALAIWRSADDKLVIAWTGPEPLRSARAGIELDPTEQAVLARFLTDNPQAERTENG